MPVRTCLFNPACTIPPPASAAPTAPANASTHACGAHRLQALTQAEKEELRQRAAKQNILQRMETARSEQARLARMKDPLASHRAGRVRDE